MFFTDMNVLVLNDIDTYFLLCMIILLCAIFLAIGFYCGTKRVAQRLFNIEDIQYLKVPDTTVGTKNFWLSQLVVPWKEAKSCGKKENMAPTIYTEEDCRALPGLFQNNLEVTPQYVFRELPDQCFKYRIKAPMDAHVAFFEEPCDSLPKVEVTVGAWENTKTYIRKDRDWPGQVWYTHQPLSEDEYRGFWISYLGGKFAIGRENENTPFASWQDPKPPKIKYYGIFTGYGYGRNRQGENVGDWIIDGEMIHTEDEVKFKHFKPVSRLSLDIRVRASRDVHIALTAGPGETSPMYEIYLEVWENIGCTILYNKEKKVSVYTPNLLSPAEDNHFLISWHYGLVQVRSGRDNRVVIEWQDPADAPFGVTHFGLRSLDGNISHWSYDVVSDVHGKVASDQILFE